MSVKKSNGEFSRPHAEFEYWELVGQFCWILGVAKRPGVDLNQPLNFRDICSLVEERFEAIKRTGG